MKNNKIIPAFDLRSILGVCLLGGALCATGVLIANDGNASATVGIIPDVAKSVAVTENATMQTAGKGMKTALGSAFVSRETSQLERCKLVDELKQKLNAAQSPEQKKQIINDFREKDRSLAIQAKSDELAK